MKIYSVVHQEQASFIGGLSASLTWITAIFLEGHCEWHTWRQDTFIWVALVYIIQEAGKQRVPKKKERKKSVTAKTQGQL